LSFVVRRPEPNRRNSREPVRAASRPTISGARLERLEAGHWGSPRRTFEVWPRAVDDAHVEAGAGFGVVQEKRAFMPRGASFARLQRNEGRCWTSAEVLHSQGSSQLQLGARLAGIRERSVVALRWARAGRSGGVGVEDDILGAGSPGLASGSGALKGPQQNGNLCSLGYTPDLFVEGP